MGRQPKHYAMTVTHSANSCRGGSPRHNAAAGRQGAQASKTEYGACAIQNSFYDWGTWSDSTQAPLLGPCEVIRLTLSRLVVMSTRPFSAHTAPAGAGSRCTSHSCSMRAVAARRSSG